MSCCISMHGLALARCVTSSGCEAITDACIGKSYVCVRCASCTFSSSRFQGSVASRCQLAGPACLLPIFSQTFSTFVRNLLLLPLICNFNWFIVLLPDHVGFFLLRSLSKSLRKLKNVDLLHWLKNSSGDGRGGSKDIRSCSGPRSALAGAKLHPPSLPQMQTAQNCNSLHSHC